MISCLPTNNFEQPTFNVTVRRPYALPDSLDRSDRYVPVFQKSREVIAAICNRPLIRRNLFAPHVGGYLGHY